MYTKTYTFEQLINIFIGEIESRRESLRIQWNVSGMDNNHLLTFFIDSWIEEAKNIKTENDFDSLLWCSLRTTFNDWFESL